MAPQLGDFTFNLLVVLISVCERLMNSISLVTLIIGVQVKDFETLWIDEKHFFHSNTDINFTFHVRTYLFFILVKAELKVY